MELDGVRFETCISLDKIRRGAMIRLWPPRIGDSAPRATCLSVFTPDWDITANNDAGIEGSVVVMGPVDSSCWPHWLRPHVDTIVDNHLLSIGFGTGELRR